MLYQGVIMLKLIKKKSQMTTELIIVSALILGIFLTLFSIIDYRNNEISSTKNYLGAKDAANEVAWAINEVYISGFGTRKTIFVINTTKDTKPLNITVLPKNRLVLVEWENNFYTSPLVTSRVVGNNSILFENITLHNGELRLTNTRGEIKLEQ
jgi:hypothetical protein